MRRQNDPKRAAILRDLLLNYNVEHRPAENPPMPPEGVLEDEDATRAFYEQWEMNPRSEEFMPEGNYPQGEGGRPDAMMSPEGPVNFELMQYLHQQMPTVDESVQPIPLDGPGGGRPRMLAERLRRG